MQQRRLALFAVIVLIASSARADTGSLGFTLRLSQIQDELNNSMVFTGPELVFSYTLDTLSVATYRSYHADLGGGVVFDREVLGIDVQITPADVVYAWNVWHHDDLDLYVGGRGLWSTLIQVYPDLNMGQDFWMTELSVAPFVLLTHTNGLRVGASMALVSVVSRPPTRRDPYEFSLNVWDILSDTHSNMRLALPSDHFHATVYAQYPLNEALHLAYTFDYRSYTVAPTFASLFHALTLSVKL